MIKIHFCQSVKGILRQTAEAEKKPIHLDFLSILSDSLAMSGLTSSPPFSYLNCANNPPIDPQL